MVPIGRGSASAVGAALLARMMFRSDFPAAGVPPALSCGLSEPRIVPRVITLSSSARTPPCQQQEARLRGRGGTGAQLCEASGCTSAQANIAQPRMQPARCSITPCIMHSCMAALEPLQDLMAVHGSPEKSEAVRSALSRQRQPV